MVGDSDDVGRPGPIMPKIRADSIAEHKKQTRRDLLDAAEQLFAARGYSATSLARVADLAGVARTTIYDYFSNKDSLVLGLVAARAEVATAEIIDAVDPSATPLAQLETLLRSAIAYSARHPHLSRLVTRVGRKLPDPEQEAMWATLNPVLAEVVRIVGVGVQTGEFPPMNVALASRMVADHIMCAVDELLRADHPMSHLPAVEDEWVRWLHRALRPD